MSCLPFLLLTIASINCSFYGVALILGSSSNHSPMVSNRPPVVSNHSQVVSNHSPTVSNHPPVESNCPPVVSNHSLIVSNCPPVLSSHSPVVSKREKASGSTKGYKGEHN